MARPPSCRSCAAAWRRMPACSPTRRSGASPSPAARSQVFRVQVVGYYDASGPVVRLEAVIDTNRGSPRILFWRDLTELGRGYDLRAFTATP